MAYRRRERERMLLCSRMTVCKNAERGKAENQFERWKWSDDWYFKKRIHYIEKRKPSSGEWDERRTKIWKAADIIRFSLYHAALDRLSMTFENDSQYNTPKMWWDRIDSQKGNRPIKRLFVELGISIFCQHAYTPNSDSRTHREATKRKKGKDIIWRDEIHQREGLIYAVSNGPVQRGFCILFIS